MMSNLSRMVMLLQSAAYMTDSDSTYAQSEAQCTRQCLNVMQFKVLSEFLAVRPMTMAQLQILGDVSEQELEEHFRVRTLSVRLFLCSHRMVKMVLETAILQLPA